MDIKKMMKTEGQARKGSQSVISEDEVADQFINCRMTTTEKNMITNIAKELNGNAKGRSKITPSRMIRTLGYMLEHGDLDETEFLKMVKEYT